MPERSLVGLDVLGYASFGRKASPCLGGGGLGRVAARTLGERPGDGGGPRARLQRKERRRAHCGQPLQTDGIRRQHGNARTERLACDEGKPLVQRWQQQEVARSEQGRDVIPPSEMMNSMSGGQIAPCPCLSFRFLAPLAGVKKFHMGLHCLERLRDQRMVLCDATVPNQCQHRRVRRDTEFPAHTSSGIAGRLNPDPVDVDPVLDNSSGAVWEVGAFRRCYFG